MSENRIGDWFLTYTGKKFYPLDPRPEDICIEDIAHALSLICRFGGHSRRHYSVAQHSVICSHIGEQAKIQKLLHDAPEAYCGDMVRPLKLSMPAYCAVEDKIWIAVAKRFDLNPVFHEEVKFADNTALMTERRDVCTPSEHRWSLQDKYPPLDYNIYHLEPEEAEELFLKRFYELGSTFLTT